MPEGLSFMFIGVFSWLKTWRIPRQNRFCHPVDMIQTISTAADSVKCNNDPDADGLKECAELGKAIA